MFKRIYLLLVFLIINLNISAQAEYGIKASFGFSKIRNSFKPENTSIGNYLMPSAQAGIFYSKYFKANHAISAELVYSHIVGKDKFEFSFIDENGIDTTFGQQITSRQISYITIPLYYEFRIKQLSLNLGFQTSFVINSKGKYKAISELNGVQYPYEENYSELGIDKLDYGPRMGMFYKLTNRLSLEGNFYYGLNTINRQQILEKLKVLQCTFGLRYNLNKKEYNGLKKHHFQMNKCK